MLQLFLCAGSDGANPRRRHLTFSDSTHFLHEPHDVSTRQELRGVGVSEHFFLGLAGEIGSRHEQAELSPTEPRHETGDIFWPYARFSPLDFATKWDLIPQRSREDEGPEEVKTTISAKSRLCDLVNHFHFFE